MLETKGKLKEKWQQEGPFERKKEARLVRIIHVR
jgi:hypothetical protein